MRPKSAKPRRDRQISYAKPINRDRSMMLFNQSTSRVSKIGKSRYQDQKKWEFKQQKLHFSDPKTLKLVSAYQPKKLKKCLMNNPKSLKDYYDSQGSCSLSKLSDTTFIRYFKQWRKDLRLKLGNLITMILETEDLDEQAFDKINQILKQLKSIAKEMISSSYSIYQSKNCSNPAEISQICESFRNLDKYIKHLAPIITLLENYIKQMNMQMDEVAESQTPLDGIKKKIRAGHRQCQKQLLQFINYCQCHPQSSLINQSQFKLKLKFDRIFKGAIQSLDKISSQKKLKQQFIRQMKQLMEQDFDSNQNSTEILQKILTLLVQNQKSKIYYRQDQNNQQQNKAQRLIYKLSSEISEAEDQFLINFKYRSFTIIKNDLKTLQSTLLVDCLDEGQKSVWKSTKKKLVILAKIYSKDRDIHYNQRISNCIKNSSQSFRDIQQTIQVLKSISQDRQLQSRRQIDKILKNLISYIQNFEIEKIRICQQIQELLTNCAGPHIHETYQKNNLSDLESQKIKRLLFLLDFSDNTANQLLGLSAGARQYSEECSQKNKSKNSFRASQYQRNQKNQRNRNSQRAKKSLKVSNLRQSKLIVPQKTESQFQQQIRQKIITNKQTISIFQKQKIGQLLDYSFQLKILKNDVLVDKLLLFQEDLDREAVHSFHVVKKFYEILSAHQQRRSKSKSRAQDLKVQQIQKLVQQFTQTMQQSNFYKNNQVLQAYLEQMFETHISYIILQKQKVIQKIITLKHNNVYPYVNHIPPSQKQKQYLYHHNPAVKQYMNSQYHLLTNIVSECQRYIKGNSVFDIYLQNVLDKIERFMKKWQFYYRFWMSQWDDLYYMSAGSLQKWMKWQFMGWIQQDKDIKTFSKNHKPLKKHNFQPIIKAQRTVIKQQINKQIQNLDKLLIQESRNYNFDNIFMNQIKRQIRNMSKYIVPLIDANKSPSYPELIDNAMKYLQKSRIRHIGLCANNQQGIALSSQGCDNIKSTIQYFEKILQLPQGSIQCNNQSLSQIKIQIEPQQIGHGFLLQQQTIPKNINQGNLILEPARLKKQQDIDEQYDNQFNQAMSEQIVEQEQLMDQQVIESVMIKTNKQQQDLNQQIIQEQAQFILPQKNTDKNKVQPIQAQTQQNCNTQQLDILKQLSKNMPINNISQLYLDKQNQYKPTIYYKFNKLANLNMIRQSIKFSQIQYHIIHDQLKIQILSKLFKHNNQEVYDQVINHIDSIIQQSSKNSLMKLLGPTSNQRKYTKSQQILIDLKKSLSDRQSQKNIKQKLNTVLSLMGISYEQIYTGRYSDKIILFDLGQSSYYCLLDLKDKYPFEITDKYLDISYIIQYEIYLLAEIVQGSKNKHIDKIQQIKENINGALQRLYQGLKQQLHKYKDYMVDNGRQIDEGVTKYYNMITNNQLKIEQTYSSKRGLTDYRHYMKSVKSLLEMIIGCKKQKSGLVSLKLIQPSKMQDQPLLLTTCPQQMHYILSSQIVMLPKAVKQQSDDNKYLIRQSLHQFYLDLHGYRIDMINSIRKRIKPLKRQTLAKIIYQDPNSKNWKQLEKSIQSITSKNKNIQYIQNNPDYCKLKTIQNILLPHQGSTLAQCMQQLAAESDLIDKVMEIQNPSTSFLLPQQQNLQLNGFQDIHQGMFVLGSKQNKLLVEHSSESLEQLSLLLGDAKISHIKVYDKNRRIVGVLLEQDKTDQIQQKISQCLNVVSPPPFQISKIDNNGTCQLQISELSVSLIASKLQQTNCKKQEFGEQSLNQLLNNIEQPIYLQAYRIKNQANSPNKPKQLIRKKLTVQNLKDQIKVQCDYPRNTILCRLIVEKDDNTEQIWRNTMSEYLYGQKFLLTEVDKYIHNQYNIIKQKKRVKRNLELQIKNRQQKQKQDKLIKQRQLQMQRLRKQQQQLQRKRKQQQRHKQGPIQQKKGMKNKVIEVVRSQGADPGEITLQLIDLNKYNKKVVSTQSDDDISQISITLSEKAQFNRNQLIQYGYYQFQDINQIINSRKQ